MEGIPREFKCTSKGNPRGIQRESKGNPKEIQGKFQGKFQGNSKGFPRKFQREFQGKSKGILAVCSNPPSKVKVKVKVKMTSMMVEPPSPRNEEKLLELDEEELELPNYDLMQLPLEHIWTQLPLQHIQADYVAGYNIGYRMLICFGFCYS